MAFKVVLWDIDGTLLNFNLPENVAVKKCFELFNLGPCTDAMVEQYSTINKKYWKMLEDGLMSKPDILVGRFREFLEVQGLDSSIASQFNIEYQNRLGDVVQPYPNALETVRALKGKVIQAVVTNGTVKTQKAKLKTSTLDQLMDYIFISDIVGYEKPDKRFFDYVLNEFRQFYKDEILIVGDSLSSDMTGGNRAGIKCCWYNPDKNPLTSDVKIDYEITDLFDVIHLCS